MQSQVIREKQDLTYLEWSKIRHSSGTAGSFLKSREEIAGDVTYYKLSDYDALHGVVGHESINEIIVDRLLSILGVEHVSYQLIFADIKVDNRVLSTYLCASKNFRKKGESKVALDVYYEMEKQDEESLLEFCIRNGWEEYIYKMFVVDYLILNRDRHGANLEVLQDSKNKRIRLAPLFDHGLSLVCTVKNNEEELKTFDVLEDRRVQCCAGSHSTYENLSLIPKGKLPKLSPLKESDRNILFKDLEDILSKSYQDKIWEMIWKRWKMYEDFCHS